MTRAADVDEELLSIVRDLTIDADYVREVVETLSRIGSSSLGFRNTGTPEDAAVADFVSSELRRFGLIDVAVEGVDVDAWRFNAASVEVVGSGQDLAFDGCSFGGVPGTPPEGITARLVDVGDPTRRRLDRLDLTGAVVLADWRRKGVRPGVFVLELARRGAVGLIVNCPAGGAWFQSDDALGTFDGHWPPGAPPVVLVRKEDAARLRAAGAGTDLDVTMTLDVDLERHGTGSNVVGYLPGDLPGPIVVGAHHDAWFRAGFDNTSGVAALLAIAQALSSRGHRPRHTICFSTRTGEEYGIAETMYGWCIGAWRQVDSTHPEWATQSPFHLCVEASGHPQLRSVVEAPVELLAWARRVCRAAAAEGWMPTGWRVAPPVAGTEQWPFLISGVPGVAAYAWETSFADTDYHTQLDTPDTIDPALVAAQARLYALLLLSADRDPDAILDHRARARQLSAIAARTGHPGLAEAAAAHRDARGREAFTPVGRGLLALDAHHVAGYRHAQCATDLAALDAAIDAVDRDQLAAAARAVTMVGSHALSSYLSDEALLSHTERLDPEAVARSFGAGCHLTLSPHLWAELATLRGETGARPYGDWVRASLVSARESTRADLEQRLTAMARSVSVNDLGKAGQ